MKKYFLLLFISLLASNPQLECAKRKRQLAQTQEKPDQEEGSPRKWARFVTSTLAERFVGQFGDQSWLWELAEQSMRRCQEGGAVQVAREGALALTPRLPYGSALVRSLLTGIYYYHGSSFRGAEVEEMALRWRAALENDSLLIGSEQKYRDAIERAAQFRDSGKRTKELNGIAIDSRLIPCYPLVRKDTIYFQYWRSGMLLSTFTPDSYDFGWVDDKERKQRTDGFDRQVLARHQKEPYFWRNWKFRCEGGQSTAGDEITSLICPTPEDISLLELIFEGSGQVLSVKNQDHRTPCLQQLVDVGILGKAGKSDLFIMSNLAALAVSYASSPLPLALIADSAKKK